MATEDYTSATDLPSALRQFYFRTAQTETTISKLETSLATTLSNATSLTQSLYEAHSNISNLRASLATSTHNTEASVGMLGDDATSAFAEVQTSVRRLEGRLDALITDVKSSVRTLSNSLDVQVPNPTQTLVILAILSTTQSRRFSQASTSSVASPH